MRGCWMRHRYLTRLPRLASKCLNEHSHSCAHVTHVCVRTYSQLCVASSTAWVLTCLRCNVCHCRYLKTLKDSVEYCGDTWLILWCKLNGITLMTQVRFVLRRVL